MFYYIYLFFSQINCKLFAYDKTNGGTWVERGRGTLRLNDKDSGAGAGVQSRVVMRTTGSLRVVLNTKVHFKNIQ
jgi:RanBP1 domain.